MTRPEKSVPRGKPHPEKLQNPPMVVFTDLDGTLLDRATYSYASAGPALEVLRRRGIPLVFCSSKTKAEQAVCRRELDVSDPFIVENGGAIFIPQGYFPFQFNYDKTVGRYAVIELGRPYQEVRAILERLRLQRKLNFKGFGDMRPEEVALETGLDLEAARRAKERDYDETIKIDGPPGEIERVLIALKDSGLNYARGGGFYAVMGANDKGKATAILVNLLKKKLGKIRTVGIGDSLNDRPMLEAVDIPVLVQRLDGSWENIDLPHLYKVRGVGPEGWTKAVEEII